MLESTGPYPPGLFPPEDVPELAFDEPCCSGCADHGLGFISADQLKALVARAEGIAATGQPEPPPAAAAASLAPWLLAGGAAAWLLLRRR